MLLGDRNAVQPVKVVALTTPKAYGDLPTAEKIC